MNDFIRVTDKGGYIGTYFWRNSGIHPDLPHWGEFCSLGFPNIVRSAWAGSIWVVRAVTKGS